jgi:hypothetical protein
MKLIPAIALCGLLAILVPGVAVTLAAPPDPGMPQYDPNGKLILPADYRDWTFLTSGLDMSYESGPPATDHVFNNVFVPYWAYESFRQKGVWPDQTFLLIEVRAGAGDVSINKRGLVQTTKVNQWEAHVKDRVRFKAEGGWGFFHFDSNQPAKLIPVDPMGCYACHLAHGAADTTFVQFYPTLLPVATRLKTLSPAYLSETASGAPH